MSETDIQASTVSDNHSPILMASQHITGALIAVLYENGQVVVADVDFKSKMIVIDCNFKYEYGTEPLSLEWAGNNENCIFALLMKNQSWPHKEENCYGLLFVYILNIFYR